MQFMVQALKDEARENTGMLLSQTFFQFSLNIQFLHIVSYSIVTLVK